MKLKYKLIMLKYKSKFSFEIKNVLLKITNSAHGAGKLLVTQLYSKYVYIV